MEGSVFTESGGSLPLCRSNSFDLRLIKDFVGRLMQEGQGPRQPPRFHQRLLHSAVMLEVLRGLDWPKEAEQKEV